MRQGLPAHFYRQLLPGTGVEFTALPRSPWKRSELRDGWAAAPSSPLCASLPPALVDTQLRGVPANSQGKASSPQRGWGWGWGALGTSSPAPTAEGARVRGGHGGPEVGMAVWRSRFS